MKRGAYKSIDLCFPMRVYLGRPKTTSVEAVNGVKISRIVDGNLDFFLVRGPNITPGLEIESHNVAGGVRIEPAVAAKGGHAEQG